MESGLRDNKAVSGDVKKDDQPALAENLFERNKGVTSAPVVEKVVKAEEASLPAKDYTTEIVAGGLAIAGIGALALATRGKSLLPAVKEAAHLPELALVRSQTLGEAVTEKGLRATFGSAKKILEIMGKAEKTEAGAVVSDDVRRSVFNRFLSRVDQDRYVLHGSYQLESQSFIARKAVKDLDLLALDKDLLKPTRAQTNEALVNDFRAMLGRDMNDGLKFDLELVAQEPLHYVFPRMRHAFAVAREESGKEVMRIPLDIRVGAGTILPPQRQVLRSAAYEGAQATEVPVSAMQPAETVAYKLFTYTNRTAGGIERKAKDLTDMASMLRVGVDENQVVKALEAWTSRGYTLGPMRHPETIMGSLIDNPRLLVGHSRAELDASYRLVHDYYARVAPRAESAALRPEVSTGLLSRFSRFMQKQMVVYPAG